MYSSKPIHKNKDAFTATGFTTVGDSYVRKRGAFPCREAAPVAGQGSAAPTGPRSACPSVHAVNHNMLTRIRRGMAPAEKNPRYGGKQFQTVPPKSTAGGAGLFQRAPYKGEPYKDKDGASRGGRAPERAVGSRAGALLRRRGVVVRHALTRGSARLPEAAAARGPQAGLRHARRQAP